MLSEKQKSGPLPMCLSDLFETYIAVLKLGRMNVQLVEGFSKIQKYCSHWYSRCLCNTLSHPDPYHYFLMRKYLFISICFFVTRFHGTFANCLLKNTSHEITTKGKVEKYVQYYSSTLLNILLEEKCCNDSCCHNFLLSSFVENIIWVHK